MLDLAGNILNYLFLIFFNYLISGIKREIPLFKMETGTEFDQACSVTMENKHFIFGGDIQQTQVCFNNFNLFFNFIFKISEVSGCSVSRVGNLPVEIRYPACAAFTRITEFALICFDDADNTNLGTSEGDPGRSCLK